MTGGGVGRILARVANDRGAAVLTVGAVLLRLALFVGRGDYVAFDEGWYLILGRNLMAGEGYTLNGTPHVALSPLFPVLAGVVGTVVGDMVWGGRIVAALASGLLVVPCWSIFRRLAGRRTAFLACVFVAVMPSLAPFVVPFWIGWDLWVGAEPLLHLLVYGGLALSLRGLEGGRPWDWVVAGALFALAYLARPEAILPFGLVGLATLALVALRWTGRGVGGTEAESAAGSTVGGSTSARRPSMLRALRAPVLLGASFMVLASPYWIYLHDATGGWRLTGRSVEIGPRPVDREPGASPAETIERMLWDDEEGDYLANLYSLDATGLRLLSPYWGVQPEVESPSAGSGPSPLGAGEESRSAADDESPSSPAGSAGAAGEGPDRPFVTRYARALGAVIPVYLVPFVLLGLAGPRRVRFSGPGRHRRGVGEILVAGPLVVTSFAVAALVAADPRTQLLVVPLAAYYAARGARLTGFLADRIIRGRSLRRGFTGAMVVVTLVALLLGTDARRLFLSVTVGSPQHVLGSGKRVVGDALRALVPEDEPVMSWHPAIAVHADRRWCVLPYADAAGIVSYARARGCSTLVVSAFHPAPWPVVDLGFEYVVLELPPEEAAASAPTTLGELDDRGRYAVGRLVSEGEAYREGGSVSPSG